MSNSTKQKLVGATAIGFLLAMAAPACALPSPPALLDGQQDGTFITDGSVLVTDQVADESHEFFSSPSALPTPTGFTSATLFLAEASAPTACSPSAAIASGSLDGCSDAFTIFANPLTGHLDVWRLSDGADATETATFFANVSSNIIADPIVETGQWQDVSADFGTGGGTNFSVFV